MVLSSQQSRPGTTRSYMFARRRPAQRLWLAGAGVLGAAVVVWALIGFFGGGGGDGGAGTGSPSDGAGDRLADANSGSSSDNNISGIEERRAITMGQPKSLESSSSVELTPPPAATTTTTTTAATTPSTFKDANSAPSGDDTTKKKETTGTGTPTGAGSGGVGSPPLVTAPGAAPGSGDGGEAAGSPAVAGLVAEGEKLVAANRLVEARERFNSALHHPQVGGSADMLRGRLMELNKTLVFSSTVVAGDPYSERYTLKGGDLLAKLAGPANVDWRFLARINGITNPSSLREGQGIKIVRGPFHAIIDKSDFRMDVYIGAPDSDGRRTYVRSFPVGLGQLDSTPVGSFTVRSGSKLINPAWSNPRTGEHFATDDPKNPIGERWIGLVGTDPDTKVMNGYGIHGTIEPETIGKQASMGCIRMHASDVEIVFEMLVEGRSTLYIQN